MSTPAVDPERFALGQGRPRPEHTPKPLKCGNCGASLSIANEHTELVVCDYCGSHLDVGAEEQKVLGVGGGQRWEFPLSLGTKYRHKTVEYEVIARLAWIEDNDPTELTRQYLLHNPVHGTLWLSEYHGHWDLSWRSHVMPKTEAFGRQRGDTIETYDNRRWVCQGSGTYELAYVDGALPWLAQVGDRQQYAEFVEASGARERYEVERSGSEVEYGRGTALDPRQVEAATGVRDLPAAGVVDENAALKARGFKRLTMIALIVLLINGVACMVTKLSGSTVLDQQFAPDELIGEVFSQPFEIANPGDLVRVKLRAPLNNSWMAVNLALVEGEDVVLHTADADMQYYHGVDGGESWSEGSRSKAVDFKVAEAGTYRLLIQASGNRGSANQAAKPDEYLRVRVIDGARMSRYFILMIIASAAVLVITGLAYGAWKSEGEED